MFLIIFLADKHEPYEVSRAGVMTPILQIINSSVREVKRLAQDHVAHGVHAGIQIQIYLTHIHCSIWQPPVTSGGKLPLICPRRMSYIFIGNSLFFPFFKIEV